jgi:hypothetical protein
MRRIVFLMVLVAVVAACDSSEEAVELTTTTSTTIQVASGTSESDDPVTTTTLSAEESTTTSTQAGQSVEDHQVVIRTDGPDGDLLWVLIDQGDYTSVDLENFAFDLLDESETAVWEIHVFDDEDALTAGRIDPEDRTADEQTLVDDHYLLSITEGVVLTYQGPYSAFGGAVFGS